MEIGTCKLCHNIRPLLRSSHIIPNFLYNTLFDNRHKLVLADPKSLAEKKSHVKRPSSGAWESNILCQHCDNTILQKYENWAKNALYPESTVSPSSIKVRDGVSIDGQEFRIYSNIDYTKFKLFVLSILWRASISTQKFFSEINLGEHEELIRKMLLTGNPGTKFDYPIFLFSWLNDPEARTDFISEPAMGRLHNFKWFVFPIRGVIYNIYTNINDLHSDLHPAILNEKNEMTQFFLPKGTYLVWLKKHHTV